MFAGRLRSNKIKFEIVSGGPQKAAQQCGAFLFL